MAYQITTGPVHHIALTVSDLDRAARFYADVLDFQPVGEFGPKRLFSNGSLLLGLGPAEQNERFDENRVGLDHVSFAVASRADIDRALAALDAHGVPHGEITPIEAFKIIILAFRDPDNIQLELTAPYDP